MILLAAVTTLALWDLSIDDGGFTESAGTGQWAWGVPTSGPVGETAWGTVLGGSYLNDAADALLIPLVDLSTTTAPVLVVHHWYDIQLGDVGLVEVDDGGGFVPVAPIYGYPEPGGFVGDSGGWVDTHVDLSALGTSPRIRFAFQSDLALAADGWFIGQVALYDGDATPPRLTALEVPTDTQDLTGPYVVRLEVLDDTTLTDVRIIYQVDGGADNNVAMVDQGADIWRAEIPAQPPNSTLTWYGLADDGEQTASWPSNGSAVFRVYLAAPTNLSGPDDRVAATQLTLSWTAPSSPHTVQSYTVFEEGYEDDPTSVSASSTGAEVPVRFDGTHTWRVVADYDVGLGDASEPLSLDVRLPTLDGVIPDSAWQGDRLYLELIGQALVLHDDTTTLDLGPGISVEDLAVIDAGHAIAVLAIEDTATTGLRTITLTSPHGVHEFSEAFTVLDGADRPRIVEVSPSRILQGETTEVFIRASEPYAGAVTINASPGLLLASDVIVDREWASVDLLALGSASPGERTLVLDDGLRLWAAPIEIEEYITPPARTCASAPPPTALGGWLGLIALVFGLRRREDT